MLRPVRVSGWAEAIKSDIKGCVETVEPRLLLKIANRRTVLDDALSLVGFDYSTSNLHQGRLA